LIGGRRLNWNGRAGVPGRPELRECSVTEERQRTQSLSGYEAGRTFRKDHTEAMCHEQT
jgi:hypothetical protein